MDEEAPVKVPLSELSEATLLAIAEDFCTRDGTDYGREEMSLERRVALLLVQLRQGQAHIVFEASTQSLRVLTEETLREAGL